MLTFVPSAQHGARVRQEELSVISHHSISIPFIHPLYPVVAVYATMYTRYTCIYTICTPLNNPYTHAIYMVYRYSPASTFLRAVYWSLPTLVVVVIGDVIPTTIAEVRR